jgi:hypothetical protein
MATSIYRWAGVVNQRQRRCAVEPFGSVFHGQRSEEAERATVWLKEEKSLDWDADLTVIGERDDLVIVRDRDPLGVRAGGGVLEAPRDGLSSFRRVALGVIGYLEVRAGVGRADQKPREEIRTFPTVTRSLLGLRGGRPRGSSFASPRAGSSRVWYSRHRSRA